MLQYVLEQTVGRGRKRNSIVLGKGNIFIDYPLNHYVAKFLFSQAVQMKLTTDGFLTRGIIDTIRFPYSFEVKQRTSKRPNRDIATRNVDLYYYLPGEFFLIDAIVAEHKDKFASYNMYMSVYDRPYLILVINYLRRNMNRVSVVEYRLPKASLSRVTLSLSEIFGRQISKMKPLNLPYPSGGVFAGNSRKPDLRSFREFAKANNLNYEGALNLSAVTMTKEMRNDNIYFYQKRQVINPWRKSKIGDSVMVDGNILFVPTRNDCEIL